MSKSNRKSPNESATSYPIGTKKKGNDGKMWVIKETASGIHRWVPAIDDSLVQIKNNNIISFDIKIITKLKAGKIKKIGYLNITSNKIGVGELLFNELPTKPGRHIIYYFHGSLMAIHEDEDPTKQVFSLIKEKAACDIGMFAIIDNKRVRPIMNKATHRIFKSSFPEFDTEIFDGKQYGYIYESDLEINDGLTVNNTNPIAVFAENQYGDGYFPIYKGKNAYWIQSFNTMDMMMDFADPNTFPQENKKKLNKRTNKK